MLAPSPPTPPRGQTVSFLHTRVEVTRACALVVPAHPFVFAGGKGRSRFLGASYNLLDSTSEPGVGGKRRRGGGCCADCAGARVRGSDTISVSPVQIRIGVLGVFSSTALAPPVPRYDIRTAPTARHIRDIRRDRDTAYTILPVPPQDPVSSHLKPGVPCRRVCK